MTKCLRIAVIFFLKWWEKVVFISREGAFIGRTDTWLACLFFPFSSSYNIPFLLCVFVCLTVRTGSFCVRVRRRYAWHYLGSWDEWIDLWMTTSNHSYMMGSWCICDEFFLLEFRYAGVSVIAGTGSLANAVHSEVGHWHGSFYISEFILRVSIQLCRVGESIS